MQHTELRLKSPDDFASLSSYVAYIRETKGYTLRDVEALTASAITKNTLEAHCSLSRGYLCNLEAGKYTHPSPFKLQALAHVYQVPYDSLLRKAGYVEKPGNKLQQDTLFTLMIAEVQEMTPTELHSLFEFIEFLKAKRGKHCCTGKQ